MKNLVFQFCAVACLMSMAFISTGQAQPARIIIDTQGELHPWNHLDVNNAAENFQFAIVTDRTGGHRPGVFPDAVGKLNLLQPEFVMSVGDLIEGYTEDEARIDWEWEEFTGFISELKVPFFYVPGNHDFINEVMARKWKERFGKDYYSFVYKDVLFLCLNSEERMRGAGKGYIDDPQLNFIRQTLEENKDVKWTLVFLHQPLWDQEDNGKWGEVEKLLSGRKHTVYAGHRHRYVKYKRNDSNYYILATTGGSSGMRGTRFGEFDHVVWITMTPEGPIMANLLLEGIWDSDVQTEESYAVSSQLMGKQPLNMNPWFIETAVFSNGSIAFKIENTSDVPMDASLRFSSHEKLWLKSDEIQLSLEPNTVEFVEIPVAAETPVSTVGLSPIQVTGQFRYRPDHFPELLIEQQFKIKPHSFYPLTESKRKVTLDGHLKEWKNLRFNSGDKPLVEANPFSHNGIQDGSFRFDTYYDSDYLYVGIEIKDDELYAPEGMRVLEQDAIALILDSRPLMESGGATRGGSLTIAWAQGASGKPIIHRPDRLPEGIVVMSQQIEGGYTAEVAIPLDYIKSAQRTDNWENIRLNVIFRDLDKDGRHSSNIYWQPDWNGQDNVLGTGMFKKE